ncbi:uncharacterized protein LOC126975867 isoform X2 [Leptidea sinapis]|nr:uncharacterized protein LOC126975867 isoform X2 [Leptidea sinapis]
MKQLTTVAVSTITYLRNVFPEDSFTTEKFAGAKLYILKKKCTDESAQFLSTALTQAFEAFDKKYLQQLVLCFYDGESSLESLVEHHIFEYTYKEDEGAAMSVQSNFRDNTSRSSKYSFQNIREKTHFLIKSCVAVMSSCPDMRPDYEVGLRLYYNDSAPLDYQAPGYQKATEPEDPLAFTLAMTTRLGCVETPFHRLVAHNYFRAAVHSSDQAIASEDPAMLSSNSNIGEPATQPTGYGTEVCCTCNKYEMYESMTLTELLTCQYCKLKQHAVCYGILDEDVPATTNHCCIKCYDNDKTRIPTDARLVPLSARNRESLCVFRRTLDICRQVQAVSVRDLVRKFDFTLNNATKLMKLLYSHGIVQQQPTDDDLSPQEIQRDCLLLVLPSFFRTGSSPLVDQLASEGFASQKSAPDPVTDALTPEERVFLRNTTSISRVIPKVTDTSANTRDALQEHREAIKTMNLDDDASECRTPTKRKLEDRGRTGVKSKRARAQPKI